LDVFGGDMGSSSVDVDALDAEAERAIEEEYDGEGGNIDELGEYYNDGTYYAEDRDPDDFE
jgi:hypothetical protein